VPKILRNSYQQPQEIAPTLRNPFPASIPGEIWAASTPKSLVTIFSKRGSLQAAVGMGPVSYYVIWLKVESCEYFVLLAAHNTDNTSSSAKYPLSLVNRLINVFKGRKLLIGYDIGCGFSSTVASSLKLASKFKESGSRFCVGSFHGHAHARKCQIDWHPLYVPGTGLEDFETCERLFSSSNALARCTRLATLYNRRELISRFMSFWNRDKYAELSL
jgi:hypothetical protein